MKKKCLLILPRNIFPTFGGYALKTINVAKILCEQYETKIIVVSDAPLCEEEQLFYESNCSSYYYYYAPKWRCYLNTLLGFFVDKPLQCAYFNFKAVRNKVKEFSQDSDIVVVATIRAVPYLDLIKNTKIKIIDMIDSIGLNYCRSIENTTIWFWRLLYKIEAKRLMKYEAKSIAKADISWFVNAQEAEFWSKQGNTAWTPMPIKEFLFEYEKKDEQYSNAIAFFGKMDYQPNIDAVLWYYNNVHTKIKNPPKLIIVGGNPTKQIIAISKKDPLISVTGFLDDPYLILNSVLAIIAPMQTGGGMQNKVLETMALGKVNILSQLAASPIVDAQDRVHFMIANTASEYEQCFTLIKDTTLLKKIEGNAKSFISLLYRFDKYKNRLISLINSIEK